MGAGGQFSLLLKPIMAQSELGRLDEMRTVLCLWGWCPDTNRRDDTLSPSHHETVKPKHPRYDCHLALVTSLDCHGRAVRTPFGLRWERCSAVDNECIHPSDSIRWLIKIKLVWPSNMWTFIISIFNVEEEWQQSSHHNPVVRSFRSKELCSDT